MVLDKLQLKVADYMTPNPISVKPSRSLKGAISIMAKKKIGNVIVNDEKGKPSSILTEREILTYLVKDGGIPDIKMKDAQTKPFATVSPDELVLDAAKILIGKKKRLLVFDDEKLVGIITASDMLKGLRTTGGNPTLEKVVSTKVYSCEYFDSIFKAINLMYKKRTGSVLIIKNNLPFGIFTERDLLGVLTKNVPLQERLANHSTFPLITAKYGIKGNDAAEIMSKNKIKRLALKKNDVVVAMVTARDVVDAYRTM
ncbi:MAG: CBS domain-containing protein [Candidatus Nitrosotalea sp.]|nr:CBS domain-containing protein [Candidatus Nitrosotalea sp.]